jgi:hypothetical protein
VPCGGRTSRGMPELGLNRDRMTKNTSKQKGRTRNEPMAPIDRIFRCHQSATMTWPIAGALAALTRITHHRDSRRLEGRRGLSPQRPPTKQQKRPCPDQVER